MTGDLFDEAGYLRLYPEIAAALMRGEIETASGHYLAHGRQEGRRPNDVDPNFYLGAYPQVAHDLGRPAVAADAAAHYLTLGRARGYLPNPGAPRAANAAAGSSPFGGLWTDQANAPDLIQGRLDLGWIRRREAAMLRGFAEEGIVAIDRLYDKEQNRAAALIVDHAFSGRFPDLLFAPSETAPDPLAAPRPWQPELTPLPVAALDPHMFSAAIRDLLLDTAVTDFLALLFGARPRLTASRAYLRDASAPGRDSGWYAYTLPLSFVAVTFALEDTDQSAGTVWPGSHRWPDVLWPGGHLSLPEARRAGVPDLARVAAGRGERLRALTQGQEPRHMNVAAGTRMVRHANLVHAIPPPEPPSRRRSITAWYCPAHVMPCYSESTFARTHFHAGVAWSSGVCPALDPLD